MLVCRVPAAGGRRKIVAEFVRTNVAACLGCKRCVAKVEGGERVWCEEAGKPAEVMARKGSCPLGKHADEQGRTVMLTVGGVKVMARGLSWWKRVWLDVDGVYPGAVEKLPGCGCIDALKRVAEWAQRATGCGQMLER